MGQSWPVSRSYSAGGGRRRRPRRDELTPRKAVNFAKYLSDKNIDIFFTAPTPDGDVLIELKNKEAHLEFIFSEAVEDKIIAAYNGDFHTEAILNDTTLIAGSKQKQLLKNAFEIVE